MTSESIFLVSKAVGQLAIPSSQGCTATPKEPHTAFAEPAFGVTTTHDMSPGKAPNTWLITSSRSIQSSQRGVGNETNSEA